MRRGHDYGMRSGATALLLAAVLSGAGCQETIRAAFSYPQAAKGPLLEPIPKGKGWGGAGGRALDDKTEMIVNASMRRAPREKGAPRELAVTVTLVDREGRCVARDGSFALLVSTFDEEAPGKAGEVLAAFRAEGTEVQAAWQEGRFERGYAFRLALRRDSRKVAGKLFTMRGLPAVVDVRFQAEEGGELRAVSAPIFIRSRR